MEHLITNLITQGCTFPPDACTTLWKTWHWIFWAGFFLGIIGGAASYFAKPAD
jgi:hypothetical protein